MSRKSFPVAQGRGKATSVTSLDRTLVVKDGGTQNEGSIWYRLKYVLDGLDSTNSAIGVEEVKCTLGGIPFFGISHSTLPK
jgi:hypothetical protein